MGDETKRATLEEIEAEATFEVEVRGKRFLLYRWNAVLAMEALGVDRVLGMADAMQQAADGVVTKRDLKAEHEVMIDCLAVAMVDPPMPDEARQRRALSSYIGDLWIALMRSSASDAAFDRGPAETTGPS